MKLIIDIPEWKYKSICEGIEASKRCGVVGIDPDIHEAIYNGTPYEGRPQGDLKSSEALKAYARKVMYEKNATNFSLIRMFDEIIDNTPSVEIATKLQPNCNNLQQRQDEWIDHSEEGYVECPVCGHLTNCESNIDELHYCWNCGTKMQKGCAERKM